MQKLAGGHQVQAQHLHARHSLSDSSACTLHIILYTLPGVRGAHVQEVAADEGGHQVQAQHLHLLGNVCQLGQAGRSVGVPRRHSAARLQL